MDRLDMTTDNRLRPIRDDFPELANGFEAVFRAIAENAAPPAETAEGDAEAGTPEIPES